MKFLAAAAFCLSCAVAAVSAQVVVEEPHPSSQNSRITILSNGKPQPGANLLVFSAEGEQTLVLKADSHGRAALPVLPPGRYRLVASTSPAFGAELWLQIANGHVSKASAFSMVLTVQPPPPPTLEEIVAAAEKAPIDLLTSVFSGTVRDPSGAVVPRASVAVYRQGASDTVHPLKTSTDEPGRFSAVLTPGKYTAIIISLGFRMKLVTVEISPDAAQKELNVKLNMGMIAESVVIAGENSNH
ncbi:MAG: carboxypeptidase-like regulatory domain-containing protein [Candidatus Acidiferrum sp.]